MTRAPAAAAELVRWPCGGSASAAAFCDPDDVTLAACARRMHSVLVDSKALGPQPLDEARIGASRPHAEHAAGTERGVQPGEAALSVEPGVARLRQRARPVVDVEQDDLEGLL